MMRRKRLLEQQQRLELGLNEPVPEGNQPRRKAGAQVVQTSVAVPLPVTPTPAECGALLKTLVKHLLFQRAQIPYLYDQLLYAAQQQQHALECAAAAGGKRRRQRLPKGDRRLLKFLGTTEEAFASIDAALAAFGVPSRCFLLLGASTSKPREAFEVVLPAAAVGKMQPPASPAAAAEGEPTGPAAAAAPESDTQEQGAAGAPSSGRPRASRQERLCQLALRQLVVAGAELPEGTAHTATCKLFLLLEGSSSGAAPGDSSGIRGSGEPGLPPLQHSVELTGASTSAAAAPRGFAVKRHFRLTMRKGTHVTLLLGRRPEELQPEGAAVGEAQAERGEDTTKAEAEEGECGSTDGTQGCEVPNMDLSQLPDAEPLSQQAAPSPPPLQGAAQAGASTAAAAGAAVGAAAPGSVWYLCKAVIKGMNQSSQEQPEG